MNDISIVSLSIMLIPFLSVIGIQFLWGTDYKKSLYALLRMITQLILVGYILMFLFGLQHSYEVLVVLLLMLFIASWISLNYNPVIRRILLFKSFIALVVGSGITIVIIFTFVLDLDPWYQPRYTIPLSGMIFANSMSAISLASDRFFSDIKNNLSYIKARNNAYKASLIPITNSFFAVGLVSIPGMMSGAVLSGSDPLVAARYQILVMLMLFSSSGLSVAFFLNSIRGIKID
ncbi:MAG: ABC transporter permease [Gammaproteobacteria bacterium]|nr:MAG: ABC transporter permease [Gammaproteobacteria bacterium]